MQPFSYHRPAAPEEAVRAATARPAPPGTPHVGAPGLYIAGGTTMTDYMALEVMRPKDVVDINWLAASPLGRIEITSAGIRFGALVRMSQAEDDRIIRAQYPVIYETLLLAATRQIRNMASLGGNVLQRTRCEYFREVSWPCNKRNPGSGCSALGGVNRQLAVLGTSESCIASYPGDLAQALVALDATVETLGPSGPRRIAFADLHKEPGDTPHVETVLAPGELITSIDVPAGPHTARSRYVKVRDRQSYQFALTSAAVALDLSGDEVRDVRIALGGVATKPWRAREAEGGLKGKPLNEDTARRAAETAFATARGYGFNDFKIPVGKETVVRALLEAKTMRVRV